MEVRVLGPVEVVVTPTGETVAIGGRSQQIVLSVLAAAGGEHVSSDALIDEMWGESPPPSALASLRTYVSRLRRVVGDTVVTRDSGYALSCATDRARFLELVASGDGASPAGSRRDLERALKMWRGRPFGGHQDGPRLASESAALGERRDDARERLAEVLLDEGQPAQALALADAVVTDNPYRERAWTVVVRALTALDRKVEALRRAQDAIEALADAGLEPGPGLRDAEQAALAPEQPLPAGRPLPVQTSSLIGREQDVAAVDEMLDRARVVTLVGPAGVGKTRLAYESAATWCRTHDVTAVVVELARTTDAAQVADLFVGGMGLARLSSADETLSRAGDHESLVVVDNCEHVVAEAARVIELLVTSGGAVTVLATSRERLGVPGEHCHRVDPLAVTGPDAPAVAMLLDRMAHAGVAAGSDDDLRYAEQVVARLDGLPLAIEMAAARATHLGLADMADALDEGLSSLRNARRHGEARHRTLRAAVEWSEDALADPTRTAFHELAVFAGPVEAVDIVGVLSIPDALTHVVDLAERSLVSSDTRRGRARFRLLAPVRDLGRERLDQQGRAEEIQRRHAEHFLAVAQEADRRLRSEDERSAHQRFTSVFDELRTAFGWALDHDPGVATALVAATSEWARARQRTELVSWTEELLDTVPESPEHALLLAWAAHHRADGADLDGAEELAERALALAADDRARMVAWDAQSDIALYRGDLARAAERAHRRAEVATQVGDRSAELMGRAAVGISQVYAGDRARGRDIILGLDPTASDPPSVRGWIAYHRGEALATEDPDAAAAELEHAISRADEVGNTFLGGVARVTRVSLLARSGSVAEAAEGFSSVVAHWYERRDRVHQVTTLRNLVVFWHRVGELERAAELLGTVVRDDVSPSFGDEAEQLAQVHEDLEASLGTGELERMMAVGTRRSVSEAARMVLDHMAEHHPPGDRTAPGQRTSS